MKDRISSDKRQKQSRMNETYDWDEWMVKVSDFGQSKQLNQKMRQQWKDQSSELCVVVVVVVESNKVIDKEIA